MKTICLFILSAAIGLLSYSGATAQSRLKKDYSYTMEIPSVLAMGSSPTHLYVLSNREGMAVFRTLPDTLQWLYSSTGMEQRGNTVTADIRFAYLFGNSRRLTVLEPTSVLGVYSSTMLPAMPLDAERIKQHLYVALGQHGLIELSLHTPASVDSTATKIQQQELKSRSIIDVESSYNQLFALSSDKKLFVFSSTSQGIKLSKELSLLRTLDHIFLINDNLWGSDSDGNIYQVSSSGDLSKMGSIHEPIQKIEQWKRWLIIKGTSNRLWTSFENRSPELWKDDGKAGNYFTVTKDQLWLCEYNQINRVTASNQSGQMATSGKNTSASSTHKLQLRPINDQIVPYPKPLLLPIELTNPFPQGQLQYIYQSDVESAQIKGNGFYWQPKAEDVGRHHFKLVATASNGQTDSTSFSVEVHSYNAPPRFNPLRPITIPVGEAFSLPVKAIDPDGMDRNLVRYLGVNLPEGASIDEQTGKFIWTPTNRQIGKNQFRVIATDQFGAASSTDITIRVIKKPRSDGSTSTGQE